MPENFNPSHVTNVGFVFRQLLNRAELYTTYRDGKTSVHEIYDPETVRQIQTIVSQWKSCGTFTIASSCYVNWIWQRTV